MLNGKVIDMSNKTIHTITNICFYLILAIVLLMAIMFYINKSPDKSIGGYRLYAATSGSMRPEINKNDEILVKVVKEPEEEVQVGDIITYAANDDGTDTVTHRVVNKYYDSIKNIMFITKGDANNANDEPVIAGKVIGKAVWTVPVLGGISTVLSENRTEFIILILVVFTIYITVSSLIRKKRSQEVN